MHTFTDNTGRTWSLSLTVDTIKRVLGDAALTQVHGKINLANLEDGEPPLVTRLATDLLLLCDVLYSLVRPQAQQQNVDDTAFGAALGGDAIAVATVALWEELADFFQKLGRTDVVTVIRRQLEAIHLAIAATARAVEGVDLNTSVTNRITAAVATALGRLSGAVPAGSESTPAP